MKEPQMAPKQFQIGTKNDHNDAKGASMMPPAFELQASADPSKVEDHEKKEVQQALSPQLGGVGLEDTEQHGIWVVVEDINGKETLRTQIDINSTDNLNGDEYALKLHKSLVFLLEGEKAMGTESLGIIETMLHSEAGFEFKVGPRMRHGHPGSSTTSAYGCDVTVDNTVVGESPAIDAVGHEIGHMWASFQLEGNYAGTDCRKFTAQTTQGQYEIKYWKFGEIHFFDGQNYPDKVIPEIKRSFQSQGLGTLKDIFDESERWENGAEFIATKIQNKWREVYGLKPMESYIPEAAKNTNDFKVADPTFVGGTNKTPEISKQ